MTRVGNIYFFFVILFHLSRKLPSYYHKCSHTHTYIHEADKYHMEKGKKQHTEKKVLNYTFNLF